MQSKRYIKPREGLVVRRPDNAQPLPAAGDWVRWSSYWRRRERDGDIVAANPPKKSKPANKKTAAEEE